MTPVTKGELDYAISIWTHSDAWLDSISRAILRIRAGSDRDFNPNELAEVRRQVLVFIRERNA